MLNKLALFVASNILLAGCFAPEYPLSQETHGSAGGTAHPAGAQQARQPAEVTAAHTGEHFGDLAAWPLASARSTALPRAAQPARPTLRAAAPTNLP